MRRHISAAKKETAPVLQEASSLMSRKAEVETKQQLLDAFNKHFLVSDEELTTLTSPTEPIDDRFFKVLNRIKGIYKDCQVLLGSSNQTLGLEVMEQSSRNLNSGYQNLYRWVQREFKTLQLENPQISTRIRQALRVLAERPSLFQSCLDAFSEVRENILLDSFHTALTGASSNSEQPSTTKPIEMFAHDPLRYIGDMLAWTHSATVSEREALEVLFISEGEQIAKGIQTGRDNEPWTRREGEEDGVFDGRKALEQLVNRDISGVARVLRQRIEQVIRSHDESILAYKIANLIKFYRLTFSKLIGSDSVLSDTLTALEASALHQFHITQSDHILSIQSDESMHPPPELSIPDFLTDALDLLTALLQTHSTSLIPTPSSSSSSSDTADDFQPILTSALDPCLTTCTTLATTLSFPSSTIFTLNCLLATKSTLAPFPTTTHARLAALDSTIAHHASLLVAHQHAFFLRSSGLQPLLDALAPLSDSDDDLRTVPHLAAFQPQALAAASRALDEFLPSALMDAMENLGRLRSRGLVRDVTERAAGLFCGDFEGVVGRLEAVDGLLAKRQDEGKGLEENESEEEEGREDEGDGKGGAGRLRLRALFPRTSAEIRVLLS